MITAIIPIAAHQWLSISFTETTVLVTVNAFTTYQLVEIYQDELQTAERRNTSAVASLFISMQHIDAQLNEHSLRLLYYILAIFAPAMVEDCFPQTWWGWWVIDNTQYKNTQRAPDIQSMSPYQTINKYMRLIVSYILHMLIVSDDDDWMIVSGLVVSK